MEHHVGRLIDHVHLRAKDLEETKRFYRAVLEAIGRAGAIREEKDWFNCDELWIRNGVTPPTHGVGSRIGCPAGFRIGCQCPGAELGTH